MKKLLVLFLLVNIQHLFAEKTDFIDNDWNKARALAKEQHKYLFVNAYTDWCYWCKVMDKKTFSQETVRDYMGKNFILLKLEMEHDYGKTVAMKFRVYGFPSFLVFNPDGKLVYRMVGYMEANKLVNKLNEALYPSKQQSYPGITEKMDLDFPDFYMKACGENGKRIFPDSLTVLQYFNKQENLFSEVNYSIIERLPSYLPAKYQQFFLDHRSKYEELYGKEPVDGVIYSLAYNRLTTAMHDSSETGLSSTLSFIENYFKDDEKKENNKIFLQHQLL